VRFRLDDEYATILHGGRLRLRSKSVTTADSSNLTRAWPTQIRRHVWQ